MAKDFQDQKDDFEALCDLWDQAQKKKIFPDPPKLAPRIESDDFDDAVGDYYHNIDREAAEDGMLHENSSSDSANPIFPDSVDKDSNFDRLTTWVDEKPIEAVADLKRKLYDIECKLNSKDAGGTKWNNESNKAYEVNDSALWNQISTLRKKIDQLSNNLGFRDDPSTSLYRTK
jgi:hypothetical protein